MDDVDYTEQHQDTCIKIEDFIATLEDKDVAIVSCLSIFISAVKTCGMKKEIALKFAAEMINKAYDE